MPFRPSQLRSAGFAEWASKKSEVWSPRTVYTAKLCSRRPGMSARCVVEIVVIFVSHHNDINLPIMTKTILLLFRFY